MLQLHTQITLATNVPCVNTAGTTEVSTHGLNVSAPRKSVRTNVLFENWIYDKDSIYIEHLP